jgi:hypothetical protein
MPKEIYSIPNFKGGWTSKYDMSSRDIDDAQTMHFQNASLGKLGKIRKAGYIGETGGTMAWSVGAIDGMYPLHNLNYIMTEFDMQGNIGDHEIYAITSAEEGSGFNIIKLSTIYNPNLTASNDLEETNIDDNFTEGTYSYEVLPDLACQFRHPIPDTGDALDLEINSSKAGAYIYASSLGAYHTGSNLYGSKIFGFLQRNLSGWCEDVHPHVTQHDVSSYVRNVPLWISAPPAENIDIETDTDWAAPSTGGRFQYRLIRDEANTGTWMPNDHGLIKFYSTYLYDDGMETPPTKQFELSIDVNNVSLDVEFSASSASSTSTTLFSDPRIYGVRVYYKNEDDEYIFMAEFNGYFGSTFSGSYNFTQMPADGTTTHTLEDPTTTQSWSSFNNNFTPKDMEKQKGTQWKTSCVVNSSLYVGNVGIPNGSGGIDIYNDRVIKSPAFKYSFLPDALGGIIEVMPLDGDSIVHMEVLDNEILIFKNNSVVILDVADGANSLKKIYKNRGIAHKNHIARSNNKVFFVNKFGCFSYGETQAGVESSTLKLDIVTISTPIAAYFEDKNLKPTNIFFDPIKENIVITMMQNDASDTEDLYNIKTEQIYCYNIFTKSWSAIVDVPQVRLQIDADRTSIVEVKDEIH